MNAPAAAAATLRDNAVALLRTLVICDLAESTALIERLGDQRAADIFRRHDRLVRGLIRQHGGQEIDKTDGFLSLFERPIQAVAFALEYQRGLRQFSRDENISLAARTGIHVGDVLVWHNSAEEVAAGAKPMEAEGLVKPVAARLMGLALPGQILLSGIAYSIAHRAEGELGATLERTRWRTHGRFRFKGVPEPVPVFEVGEEGIAPLKVPAWTGKAHRETPIWRRPLMLAFEALVILALIAVPVWQLLQPQPAIAFAERDWVVVGDLRNLTGDSRFDNALQEAFRIGLEQSRHVNVLSDLSLRNTLELMQRDPKTTAISRELGAELALREGARALILPSIAEIGGRVRFTAEVIDPSTQTTVYADFADGNGVESVLPSVDAVNRKLRERLGEALTTVSKESLPLDKVATADFDALRAYTQAIQAKLNNRLSDAVALLQQAIAIDADFAKARFELALILRDTGDRAGALKEWAIVAAHRDRLTVRDRMNLDAMIASASDTPAAAIKQWRLLSELYPDFYVAQNSLGFYTWQGANRHDLAIAALQRGLVPQNPRRGSAHYVLGSVYLSNDQYDRALEQFELSVASGRRFENQFYAAVYAAQRQFDRAYATLARGQASGIAATEITGYLTRAAFALDQGRWSEAQDLMRQADAQARPIGRRHARMLDSIALSLATITQPTARQSALISRFVREDRRPVDTADDPVALVDRQRRLLFAAWLAARADDSALARRSLSLLDPGMSDADYPELAQRRVVAEAELARLDGRPNDALRELKRLLDGSELYCVHLALMTAYAAVEDWTKAREQAQWLATHRGRAYAEMQGDHLMQLFNVAHSTLSQLAASQHALAAGDPEAAAVALRTFQATWPDAELPAPVAEHLAELKRQLAAATREPERP